MGTGAVSANPQSAQFVMIVNNAIKADMDPSFRARFDREFTSTLQNLMNQPLPIWQLQQMTTAMLNQMANKYAGMNGADNHRAALTLFLTNAAFNGQSPENLASALQFLVSGERWARTGNFGNVLRQLGI